MNQCSNCKWWERDEEKDDHDRGEGFGVCELATGDDGEPKHEQTKAYAGDSDGYYAWLNTRYDFGCNQWEPKEETAEYFEAWDLSGKLIRYPIEHGNIPAWDDET